MKKYKKELILLVLQAYMFYLFPLFAGPTDVMGMVFLIIVSTFALGYFFGMLSRWKWKWVWPTVVSLLFLPTVPIYYNFTAMIHAMWYLVISAVGMLLGVLTRKLFKMK